MSDELVHELEHGAGKVGKALGEDMAHGLSGVYHETAENLHKVATNVEENEKKVVRKYFIDDRGNVSEIVDGKLKAVDLEHDESGIKGILDPERAKPGVRQLTEEEKTDLSANQKKWESLGRGEGEWVESERIEKPTALSEAVEEARRAQKKGKGDYGGSNYAALHYASADGKHEFILVGRSSQLRSHSERSIGYPMVHEGKQYRVDELYTERRPCQSGSTCDRWLNMYIYHPEHNPGLRVTHGVQYDSSVPTPARDLPFKGYINQLRLNHKAHLYGGVAGTKNFDNPDPVA